MGVRNSENIWQQQSLSSAFDLIRPQTFISSDDYHLYVGSMNDDRTELQDVILVQTADQGITGAKPDLSNLGEDQQSQDSVNTDTAQVDGQAKSLNYRLKRIKP